MFWASRIQIRQYEVLIRQYEVLIRQYEVLIRFRLRIFLPSSKNNKKKLYSSCFVTSLSLKNCVNLALKGDKQQQKFFLQCWSRWILEPDPSVSGMDPRIRISTKMSRSPNTAFLWWKHVDGITSDGTTMKPCRLEWSATGAASGIPGSTGTSAWQVCYRGKAPSLQAWAFKLFPGHAEHDLRTVP